MNFFEHQSLARRNSRVMVALFLLAVAAIVLAVDLVVGVIYLFVGDAPADAGLAGVPRGVFTAGAVVTIGIIAAVSLWSIVGLAGGGAKVARMLGGRKVTLDTHDPLERRFVNIVEEMAIASGVRVPEAWIMDGEKGINAFSAGWTVSGAVVGVTRGALERLTRDELQGVIGHEFSHILNGDMGLNIRMLGVLAGIVAIGSIGSFLMRAGREADDIRGVVAVFGLGLALFVIGYVGLFFARLIKGAVSRQREFLADASSVQFTRNPDGIAGALDQIRAAPGGARIRGRYAEDMSHLFFGQGIQVTLSALFDTHPPLDERIRRVNPRFQPSRYRPTRALEPDSGERAQAPPAGRREGDFGTAWGRTAAQSAQLVGALMPEKLGYAERLLAQMPPALRESLREAEGAAAAVIALLLAEHEDVRRQQLEALLAAVPVAPGERASRAREQIHELGLAFHLPLIDLALPALKAASELAKHELLAALEAVVNADRRVTLHEFIVLTLVREQLWRKPKPPRADQRIAGLQPQAGTLLALLAHAGTRADATGARAEALQQALRAGAEMMEIEVPATTDFAPAVIRAALEALKSLAPLQKALLIKGLFAAVTADGTIRVVEAGVMRMVGAVLDCPLPPLLDEVEPIS
ncbi:MAG TPA: M48 family metallopeptidase [Burkholderiales bacterium]|nr:M48 family metallopeptidase [Burkholderiales bacterium]